MISHTKHSFAISKLKYCDLIRNQFINIKRYDFERGHDGTLAVGDFVTVQDGINITTAQLSMISNNYYQIRIHSKIKTLVIHGLYGLTHTKTKNQIVQTKNQIVQTKNQIVSHFKTLVIHGLYGLTHTKTKNQIVQTKNQIVSHFKTLVIHGLYGLTHTKTKNQIVQTKNQIVQTKNQIVQTKNQIVQTKNQIVNAISNCFYIININRKILK